MTTPSSALRERLATRIAQLVASPRVNVTRPDLHDTYSLLGPTGEPPPREELERLLSAFVGATTQEIQGAADTFARFIEALAADLIPDARTRAAALERPELADRWLLTDLPPDVPEHLDALLFWTSVEAQACGSNNIHWPANLAPEALANALHRLSYDDDASSAHATFCAGLGTWFIPERFTDTRSDTTKPREFYLFRDSLSARTEARTDRERALRRWPIIGCALLLSAELLACGRYGAELAEADGSPVAAARWAWKATALLATDDAEALDVRRAIVADVLREPEEAPELASTPNAASELERDLRRTVDTMRERCGLDGPSPATDAEACALDGALPFAEARFAAFLETLGANGGKAARAVREKGSARAEAGGAAMWTFWTNRATSPAGFRWARLLARVVWADVTAPRLRQRAALVRPVFQDVTRLHSRTFLREERNGQGLIRFTDGAPPVELVAPPNLPTFELGTLEPLLARGLDKLGSVTGHKVLRWEVNEGHDRYMRGEADPRALRVEGGWAALAHDVLQLASNKARGDVREIVLAQAHCRFELPNRTRGNLLSYTEPKGQGGGAARGKRAVVTITLGDALLPSFVHTIESRSLAGRTARRLVPLLDLPPLVGRPNEHGPQATLSMLLAAEFRDRVRELLDHEGVRLTLEDFQALAGRAGLSRDGSLILAIIDRWTHDGPDGPALLRAVGPDRYTLGPAHRAALDFMLAGGRLEQGGEAGGKASARKRAATLTRKAGTRRGKGKPPAT